MGHIDLTVSKRKRVLAALEKCPTGVLEKVLSSEDVYLGFQHELLQLDSKSRHSRLAELVLLIVGTELLRNTELRTALCDAAGVPPPSSWRPGSGGAVALAASLGFPLVFAGAQHLPSPPPIAPLESGMDLPPLHDYQEEVYEETLSAFTEGYSGLLSVPAGGGKTRVAVQALREWHTRMGQPFASLWIAHTEELCDQACECISEVWRSGASPSPAALLRVWGKNTKRMLTGEIHSALRVETAVQEGHAILVSTPASALRLFEEARIGSAKRAIDLVGVIIIDEAHRAAANSYRALIRMARQKNAQCRLLGLSATPVRATYASHPFEGTAALSRLFDRLIEPKRTLGTESSPQVALQERGVLAKLNVETIPEDTTRPLQLARAVALRRRRLRSATPALLFTQTVSESKVLAAYLCEQRVRAAFVEADSSTEDREATVRQLRNREIDVLCNCELLTTGFDAPSVSEIYLARYTESPVLYKQIIGRGLRGPSFGGSERCQLILCGIHLPFDVDPGTVQFARRVWAQKQ